jgi:hypothetical protein
MSSTTTWIDEELDALCQLVKSCQLISKEIRWGDVTNAYNNVFPGNKRTLNALQLKFGRLQRACDQKDEPTETNVFSSHELCCLC